MQIFTPPAGFHARQADGGFHQLIGPFYVEGDGSNFCYGFYVDERHTNPADVVHGGLLMTLMDMVLTTTVIQATELKNHVSTITMNCDFLAPVLANRWVDGKGEIVRRTKSLAFVRGRLQVAGTDAVTATGVWRVFNRPLVSATLPTADLSARPIASDGS